jgi:1,2-diacylglycerol 3-alpha-glucosyltransferase
VPGFPKDEQDGTCIPALQQYIYHFAKLNPDIKIAVIAFQYPCRKQKYQWHGIEIYPCRGEDRRRVGRLITWLKAIRYMLQIHFKNKVLLIHSFWLEECAFIGQAMSKILVTKHIGSVMGQDALKHNFYLKYLDYASMVITAASSKAADISYRFTGRKVDAIIPIGLDVDNFHPTTKSRDRKIDVLGVGALTVLKNYQLFIEVIAKLKTFYPEIQATVIGEGSEYRNLEQMIYRYELENNIRLLGKLPRTEVIEYMYQSKILLHPSTYESQGYVFLEALYCGQTVVCFNVGYTEESKKMIICNDKQDMLNRMKLLLKKPLDFDPMLMKSIDETVTDFYRLYFSNIQ